MRGHVRANVTLAGGPWGAKRPCDGDGYRPDTAKELLESTEYDEYRR